MYIMKKYIKPETTVEFAGSEDVLVSIPISGSYNGTDPIESKEIPEVEQKNEEDWGKLW